MSLQMLIGDVKSFFGNQIQNQLDTSSGLLKNIVSSIGVFHANIWGTGFAGVSNFTQLKSAINSYSKRVKDCVNQYNANAKIDNTFKGKAAEETKNFIGATKQLLTAYVGLVEKWNKELDDAYAKYQSGDKTLSQKVSQDTQNVRTKAQQISLG